MSDANKARKTRQLCISRRGGGMQANDRPFSALPDISLPLLSFVIALHKKTTLKVYTKSLKQKGTTHVLILFILDLFTLPFILYLSLLFIIYLYLFIIFTLFNLFMTDSCKYLKTHRSLHTSTFTLLSTPPSLVS